MSSAAPIIVDTKRSRVSRMQRAVMKGTTLHSDHAEREFVRKARPIFATLTYRKDVEPTPNDVRKLIRTAVKWFARKMGHRPKEERKLRYVWVAELTKKGKLHYHALFFLPPGMKLPKLDKCGWWKHGQTQLAWARNAVAYMAKYASKGGGSGRKAFPKGFRLHGSGGFNKLERNERRYHLAPGWVRHFFTLEERPKPAAGGGWVSSMTGDWQASPFFVVQATAGRVVVGVRKWYAEILSQQQTPELIPCLK